MPKHKGVVGLAEKLINTLHHSRRGTPVGIERITSVYFIARFHVGKNIGPAKRVNSLFRIAYQKKPAFRLVVPDTTENTILLGVGILKFINHGDRETGADRRCQRLATRALQGAVQPTQHVVKTEFATATLFSGHRFTDLAHRAG